MDYVLHSFLVCFLTIETFPNSWEVLCLIPFQKGLEYLSCIEEPNLRIDCQFLEKMISLTRVAALGYKSGYTYLGV